MNNKTLQNKEILDFISFFEKFIGLSVDEQLDFFHKVVIDFSNLSKSDENNINLVLKDLEKEEDKISFLNQINLFNKSDILLDMYKKNINKLLLLDRAGIHSDIANNFKKLQEINPGVNPDSYVLFYNLQLLQSPVFEKLGSQFISDILEYSYVRDGMKITEDKSAKNSIDFFDNQILDKLIKYLQENGIYSKKNMHRIMHFYDKCMNVINYLITNNYKLSNIEKENFVLYFQFLEDNLLSDNEIAKKIDIKINNLIDLRNFKDIYLEQIFNSLDNTNNIDEIKEILCYSLFRLNLKKYNEIFNNEYILDKIRLNKQYDLFDDAIIEIIKDINNSETDVELKQKYRDIIKKNIRLKSKIENLEQKIQNLEEETLNNEIIIRKNTGLNILKKSFEDKEIDVIEMDGNFSMLIHVITDGWSEHRLEKKISRNADTQERAEKILEHPELWNGVDLVSTLSCSLISDKYMFHYGNSDKYRIIYGFDKLPNNVLCNVSKKDAWTEWGNNVYHLSKINIINTNRLLKNSEYHNEIAIFRKNSELKDNNGRIQPSYIVSFESEPTEIELKHAAYFGIPIIHVDKEKYSKLNEEKTEKYKSGNLESFTIDDVKEILHLRTFTEKESINIIMNYLDNSNLSKQDFFILSEQIKNEFINYFIDNKEDIDNAINILNQHINNYYKNYSEESVNNGFTK